MELDEVARTLETDQRVREVVRIGETRRDRVRRELPPRREEQMRERRGDGSQDREQEAGEEAADPRQLEERRREEDGVGLGEDIARADVCELVREHRAELVR